MITFFMFSRYDYQMLLLVLAYIYRFVLSSLQHPFSSVTNIVSVCVCVTWLINGLNNLRPFLHASTN